MFIYIKIVFKECAQQQSCPQIGFKSVALKHSIGLNRTHSTDRTHLKIITFLFAKCLHFLKVSIMNKD